MQDTLHQASAQALGDYEDIRRRRDISGNAKVIFAWLVPLVVRGVHPGTRVISQECGCSRGAATRALEQLRDAGLLDWTPGPNGCGRTYCITTGVHGDPPALCDGETLTVADRYNTLTLTRAQWRMVAESPEGRDDGLSWNPLDWYGNTSVHVGGDHARVRRDSIRQWVETGVYPEGDSC